MRFIKRSTKWLRPYDVGFVVSAWLVGIFIGVSFFHTPASAPERALISNRATVAEVVANLDGKHVADTGEYLAGYACAAWTNGNKATQHGWFVEYCVK